MLADTDIYMLAGTNIRSNFPGGSMVSGNFCANIKVANYRFKLQDGT